MTEGPRNPKCRACPLWESCKSVCVPMRPFVLRKSRKPRALLIVGEAPGATEDDECKPFVGPAGRILSDAYIKYFKFHEDYDVYLTNAVRCRPPGNSTPTKTQIRACQSYLLGDVSSLQRDYEEVVVLAVGGPATLSCAGTSAKQWRRCQGQLVDLRGLWRSHVSKNEKSAAYQKWQEHLERADCPEPEPFRLFSTYHPSAVSRDRSRGPAVEMHLRNMQDALKGNLEYELPPTLVIREAPEPPSYPISILSLDIETYGFHKGLPIQNFFHPVKMRTYDKVHPRLMVVTVALSWRDPSGELEHAIFVPSKATHRRRLRAFLARVREQVDFRFLLGQNLKFDLKVLRYCYPELRPILDRPLPVMDLTVANYLHDEGRPERSLKDLAPLLRVTSYDSAPKDMMFSSASDPLLWQYNCQDTGATLLCYEKLERMIRDFYGEKTQKLSEECLDWYSDVLWWTVWAEEAGIAMDTENLQYQLDVLSERRRRLSVFALEQWGIPLYGTGSQKAKREIMQDAMVYIEEHVPAKLRPTLELTEKTKEISFNATNRNALLNVLDRNCESGRQLRAIALFHEVGGILDRYLYPILRGRGKGHVDQSTRAIGGIVYPNWFPVPSQYEDDTSGGTKQVRAVCKTPPCQTFPPRIKNTIHSRHAGGAFIWWDYSQIELRVAALLSGDRVFLEAYQRGEDVHAQTARVVFGDRIVHHRDFKRIYRQAGKTLNFLVLFLGGADTFRETLLRDVGLDLPARRAKEIIDEFWGAHEDLRQWQHATIDSVHKRGYFELPVLGQSRLFLENLARRECDLPEVVNMPIQSWAAAIMLSAQADTWYATRQAGLRAVFPINIYDAMGCDCPRSEVEEVCSIADDLLPRPKAFQLLCNELGRTIPLVADRKVTYNAGSRT